MPTLRTRASALICLVALAALAAGCGASSDPDAAADPGASPSGGSASSGESYPGFPAFGATPPMFKSVEDQGDTVLIRHEFGETEVPKDPQRVYADPSVISTAVQLGLPVVAGEAYDDLAGVPEFAEQVTGADLGSTGEIGFERIAAAEPDLILAPVFVQYPYPESAGSPQQVYDKLSQIAPVVVFDADPWTYWREGLLALGEAMDRTDEAEAAVAEFDSAVDTACQPIREAIPDDESVLLLAPEEGTDVYVYTVGYEDGSTGEFVRAADSRWLYDYCGRRPPADLASLATDENSYTVISPELFGRFTADHIFLGDDDGSSEPVQELPVWQGVPAVEAGHTYVYQAGSSYDRYTSLAVIESAARAVP